MKELWDAYDHSFQKIKNETLVRGEKIPEGMYHLVSEVIVRHEDGTYLLMQRDLNKNFGGLWELGAGGSVLQKETALQGVLRELKEETGIQPKQIIEVDQIIHEAYQTIFVIFECITDCDQNTIQLQVGETIAYQWIDLTTLQQMDEDLFFSKRTLHYIKENMRS